AMTIKYLILRDCESMGCGKARAVVGLLDRRLAPKRFHGTLASRFKSFGARKWVKRKTKNPAAWTCIWRDLVGLKKPPASRRGCCQFARRAWRASANSACRPCAMRTGA